MNISSCQFAEVESKIINNLHQLKFGTLVSRSLGGRRSAPKPVLHLSAKFHEYQTDCFYITLLTNHITFWAAVIKTLRFNVCFHL